MTTANEERVKSGTRIFTMKNLSGDSIVYLGVCRSYPNLVADIELTPDEADCIAHVLMANAAVCRTINSSREVEKP